MGTFSSESLQRFNEMCADKYSFSENNVFDFARCVRPDGSAFGTRGRCLPPNRPAPSKASSDKGECEGILNRRQRKQCQRKRALSAAQNVTKRGSIKNALNDIGDKLKRKNCMFQ